MTSVPIFIVLWASVSCLPHDYLQSESKKLSKNTYRNLNHDSRLTHRDNVPSPFSVPLRSKHVTSERYEDEESRYFQNFPEIIRPVTFHPMFDRNKYESGEKGSHTTITGFKPFKKDTDTNLEPKKELLKNIDANSEPKNVLAVSASVGNITFHDSLQNSTKLLPKTQVMEVEYDDFYVNKTPVYEQMIPVAENTADIDKEIYKINLDEMQVSTTLKKKNQAINTISHKEAINGSLKMNDTLIKNVDFLDSQGDLKSRIKNFLPKLEKSMTPEDILNVNNENEYSESLLDVNKTKLLPLNYEDYYDLIDSDIDLNIEAVNITIPNLLANNSGNASHSEEFKKLKQDKTNGNFSETTTEITLNEVSNTTILTVPDNVQNGTKLSTKAESKLEKNHKQNDKWNLSHKNQNKNLISNILTTRKNYPEITTEEFKESNQYEYDQDPSATINQFDTEELTKLENQALSQFGQKTFSQFGQKISPKPNRNSQNMSVKPDSTTPNNILTEKTFQVVYFPLKKTKFNIKTQQPRTKIVSIDLGQPGPKVVTEQGTIENLENTSLFLNLSSVLAENQEVTNTNNTENSPNKENRMDSKTITYKNGVDNRENVSVIPTIKEESIIEINLKSLKESTENGDKTKKEEINSKNQKVSEKKNNEDVNRVSVNQKSENSEQVKMAKNKEMSEKNNEGIEKKNEMKNGMNEHKESNAVRNSEKEREQEDIKENEHKNTNDENNQKDNKKETQNNKENRENEQTGNESELPIAIDLFKNIKPENIEKLKGHPNFTRGLLDTLQPFTDIDLSNDVLDPNSKNHRPIIIIINLSSDPQKRGEGKKTKKVSEEENKTTHTSLYTPESVNKSKKPNYIKYPQSNYNRPLSTNGPQSYNQQSNYKRPLSPKKSKNYNQSYSRRPIMNYRSKFPSRKHHRAHETIDDFYEKEFVNGHRRNSRPSPPFHFVPMRPRYNAPVNIRHNEYDYFNSDEFGFEYY